MRTFGAYKELVEQGWSLFKVRSGHRGLAVMEDDDGHWAGLIWPSSLPGLWWLPEPPGSLVQLQARAAQELDEMKLDLGGWCGS